MKHLSIFVFAAVTSSLGCGSDSGTSNTSVDCSAQDVPTYDTFGQAFMTEYCASCHSASVKGAARMSAPTDDQFDELAEIQHKSDELTNEVVTERSMPYGNASKKPSDDERKLFDTWMRCGAK
jgi:uncharacterized membrane protein